MQLSLQVQKNILLMIKKSMFCSKAIWQSHSLIIIECRCLCLVPSLKEPMPSILLVHLPSQQYKCLTLSIQRRIKQRIKLVLCLIHLWPVYQQPLLPWYSLHLILAFPLVSLLFPSNPNIFFFGSTRPSAIFLASSNSLFLFYSVTQHFYELSHHQ